MLLARGERAPSGGERLVAARAEHHELGAAVGRVRNPPDIPVGLEVVDELADGLLRDAAEGAAELAVSIGLPPDPEARRILDAPYATLVPPSLEAPGTAMPAHVVHYRLTAIHTGDSPPTPRGTGPLVWIALGTETWRIPGLLERLTPLIHDMAAALPDVRFLLTVGADDISVPTMPANVHVAPYVPQEAVLEACDVVLGHCGFNTMIAALSRGLPLVAMPLFASDQFDNAARLSAVGAAVAVTQHDPGTLGDAVQRCLTDPTLAAVAGRLAAEMADLPSPADALERLLEQAPPSTAVDAP